MLRRPPYLIGWFSALLAIAGCSRGPARVDAPNVDPEGAANKAIELYDFNSDLSLSEDELASCPGMLVSLSLYDQDGNRRVDRDEVAQRLSELFKNRVGLTQLRSRITYRGKPLAGATLVFEPEPYLAEEIQVAQGTTNVHGSAQMSINQDKLPEHVRAMKLIQYGTYKVRITHPSIKLPPKYNSETALGYETRIGDPFATFALTSP
jgi:hypothetical protein